MLYDLCLKCKHHEECYHSMNAYRNFIDKCLVRQEAAKQLEDSSYQGIRYYEREDVLTKKIFDSQQGR